MGEEKHSSQLDSVRTRFIAFALTAIIIATLAAATTSLVTPDPALRWIVGAIAGLVAGYVLATSATASRLIDKLVQFWPS